MKMISTYDYKCPYCKRIDNVTTSNQPSSVSDIEICRFCMKGAKITYAKIIYETKMISNPDVLKELEKSDGVF